jgi:hypothetical protein
MKAKIQNLSADDVRAILDYDPDTGEFRWKTTRGHAQKGALAGSKDRKGYITIRVNFTLCYAHRLAWLVTHGFWPENQIDHIDCDKSNNRISNLREATNSQNQANRGIDCRNTSGRKGVSWNKSKGKWEARTRINNEQKFIGYFDDIHSASIAYNSAVSSNFGEYARIE